MFDFIRENFLILSILVAIIIVFFRLLLKRRGIKLEEWEGQTKDTTLDEALEIGRDVDTNPAFSHFLGNIYYKRKE